MYSSDLYANLVSDDSWHLGLTLSLGIRSKALTVSEIWNLKVLKNCLKIWFQVEKSWFSTIKCQFSFCFHQSLSSSTFWQCLLSTRPALSFNTKPNLPHALWNLGYNPNTFLSLSLFSYPTIPWHFYQPLWPYSKDIRYKVKLL